MKISRIHIENFRSIKKLTFEPGNICALVGENGAGKSNILAALDFLLGERWPTRQRLEASDFFGHDESRTVTISVEFENNTSGVEKIWCKFQQYKRDVISHKCKWDKSGPGDRPSESTSDMRENLPLIFMDAHRDVDKHFKQSRWALFGRILHRFHGQFPEEKLKDLEGKFEEALKLLRTDDFIQFEAELARAYTDQIRHEHESMELEFKAFDPLSYYKSINLMLKEGERTLPLAEAGDGMRNMAIIAMFRAYANHFRGDAILAIEEPELYLHPHAGRNLAKLFRELTEEGAQLFYTTHSSQFVDIEYFDEICLVERKEDEQGELCTQIRQVPATKFCDIRKTFLKLDSITVESIRARYHNLCSLEHSEAFFARKIVLVEGESEEYAFPIYAVALDYDFDAHGVSIVNAHGKKNLDSLYQLYVAFGIPVYLIFDSDQGTTDESNLDYNETLLRMLNEPVERILDKRVRSTYAIADKDFETVIRSDIGDKLYTNLLSDASKELGTKIGKGIKARYIANSLSQKNRIPKFVCKIIDAIRELGA